MKTEFFLIGDSHAVAIGKAARAAGMAFKGGPLGTGKELEAPFFELRGSDFILTRPGSAGLQAEWKDLLHYPGPILSTLGFNTHRFAQDLQAHVSKMGAKHWQDLMSRQAFERIVMDARAEALRLYKTLGAHGRDVYFTHSPQRASGGMTETMHAFEKVLIAAVSETGAKLIDVRAQATDGTDYGLPGDPVHANVAYGQLVLDAFKAKVDGSHALASGRMQSSAANG